MHHIKDTIMSSKLTRAFLFLPLAIVASLLTFLATMLFVIVNGYFLSYTTGIETFYFLFTGGESFPLFEYLSDILTTLFSTLAYSHVGCRVAPNKFLKILCAGIGLIFIVFSLPVHITLKEYIFIIFSTLGILIGFLSNFSE